MKTYRRHLSALFACFVVSSSLAQGPLVPPGAPAPTMKTLQQIEPRTPITNLPYTITQPGSYYLAGNLTSTGHGVWVQTNNVTLDLMGFSIEGPGLQSVYGVYILNTNSPVLRNVIVKNGILSRFDYGVFASQVEGVWIEGVHAWSNRNHGILISNGLQQRSGGNVITRCVAGDNGQFGIYISDNGGGNDGNTITHCSVVGNKSTGIVIANGSGNVVEHNTIARNTTCGLWLFSAGATRVENNHITGQTDPTTTYGMLSQDPISSNFIFSNTTAGNTTNYLLSATDVYGPIVTTTGPLATTGAGLHPRANYSR